MLTGAPTAAISRRRHCGDYETQFCCTDTGTCGDCRHFYFRSSYTQGYRRVLPHSRALVLGCPDEGGREEVVRLTQSLSQGTILHEGVRGQSRVRMPCTRPRKGQVEESQDASKPAGLIPILLSGKSSPGVPNEVVQAGVTTRRLAARL